MTLRACDTDSSGGHFRAFAFCTSDSQRARELQKAAGAIATGSDSDVRDPPDRAALEDRQKIEADFQV